MKVKNKGVCFFIFKIEILFLFILTCFILRIKSVSRSQKRVATTQVHTSVDISRNEVSGAPAITKTDTLRGNIMLKVKSYVILRFVSSVGFYQSIRDTAWIYALLKTKNKLSESKFFLCFFSVENHVSFLFTNYTVDISSFNNRRMEKRLTTASLRCRMGPSGGNKNGRRFPSWLIGTQQQTHTYSRPSFQTWSGKRIRHYCFLRAPPPLLHPDVWVCVSVWIRKTEQKAGYVYVKIYFDQCLLRNWCASSSINRTDTTKTSVCKYSPQTMWYTVICVYTCLKSWEQWAFIHTWGFDNSPSKADMSVQHILYLLLTHIWAEVSADPLSLMAWHVYRPWSSVVILSIWRLPSFAITIPKNGGVGSRLQKRLTRWRHNLWFLPDPSCRSCSSLYQVMVGGGTPRDGQLRVRDALTLTVQSVRLPSSTGGSRAEKKHTNTTGTWVWACRQ